MNSNRWNNIDLIYPEGGTFLDDVWYSNQEIKDNFAITEIHSYLMKPARQMIEKEWDVIHYDNGYSEMREVYSVLPSETIDDIPLLSVYGQMMLNSVINNIINNSEENNENEEDFIINYSSL